MANPIQTAVQGKGAAAVLRRARSISRRYGVRSSKIDRSLALMTETLRPYGYKATLPVTAVALRRHPTLVQQYQALGIEFAVHGLVHVDYSQLSAEQQQLHLRRAVELFQQAGIRAAGFRCPYLRGNGATLAAIQEVGLSYDSSESLAWDVTQGYETPAYRHVLGFYGAQAAARYPALPRLQGGVVQIPYCLPDDEALVERLEAHGDGAKSDLWVGILEQTHASGELFTVGLHPERTDACRAALRATLKRAAALQSGVWIARLDEIARWWRSRAGSSFRVAQTAEGQFHVEIMAPKEATILVRDVQISEPTGPWWGGFRSVTARAFSFRANKRPFIGVAPDVAPGLREFLTQQGYLAETIKEAQSYPVCFERTRFTREDERPLLAEIERTPGPLVRLARWPHGKRSALAITGDIDAFTLLDYGLRMLGS
jgi:hypothetical protein